MKHCPECHVQYNAEDGQCPVCGRQNERRDA